MFIRWLMPIPLPVLFTFWPGNFITGRFVKLCIFWVTWSKKKSHELFACFSHFTLFYGPVLFLVSEENCQTPREVNSFIHYRDGPPVLKETFWITVSVQYIIVRLHIWITVSVQHAIIGLHFWFTVSVIVLSRKSMSTSTNCYLIGLAIADLLFLILLSTLLAYHHIEPDTKTFYMYQVYIAKVADHIKQGSKTFYMYHVYIANVADHNIEQDSIAKVPHISRQQFLLGWRFVWSVMIRLYRLLP